MPTVAATPFDPMSRHRSSSGRPPSLGQRILAWLRGGRPGDPPGGRQPIDKPFPFFGD